MKNMTKMILILVAGLMMAQCSTYKIKPDMNKSGVVNKTPKIPMAEAFRNPDEFQDMWYKWVAHEMNRLKSQ